mmetsp:Transcript_12282/g.37480  ORF Transcript_12282/g.37480 Transcript_12282/m.37480 type:complete len:247 (+) Transcript_12282:103-843(+)|eukprot:CAMPEP_0198730658 /NCGR_PEP_ID=MMETSP1475-20131203/25501_1 /TAXON_ID= ORGANISM="Unidentified sp., Strain CCMP1999" /NCGR_SAMPLE_ID=MMETSP1475 /ASSEMBLY_ACC=CAM_ASM_001111 /LENGTH=246 /DNA_ID=CAMNT_0044493493 /DNA_START=75 /DNA_END=815 /DNA_ORIENTATION=+
MAETIWLSAVFFGLLLAVLAVFAHVGAFHKTEVSTVQTEFESLTLWYKFHVSSYVGIISAKLDEMIRDFGLLDAGRAPARICVILYDNPYDMQKRFGTDGLCRWAVGVALDKHEREKLGAEEFEKLEAELQERGFKPFVIRGGEVLKVSFPLKINRTFRALNRTLRVQMVYPLLIRTIMQRKLVKPPAALEIYLGGSCDTMFPLAQDTGSTWVVREAKEMQPEKVFANLQREIHEESSSFLREHEL